jgi:hypothetical protein
MRFRQAVLPIVDDLFLSTVTTMSASFAIILLFESSKLQQVAEVGREEEIITSVKRQRKVETFLEEPCKVRMVIDLSQRLPETLQSPQWKLMQDIKCQTKETITRETFVRGGLDTQCCNIDRSQDCIFNVSAIASMAQSGLREKEDLNTNQSILIK